MVGHTMTPDPRWLELLKASGWQTAGISIACGLFLLGAHLGWLPPLEPWMVLIATRAPDHRVPVGP